MFQYCSELQSVTIPSTVNEIGSGAFSLCVNLQEVVLKEGLKTISSSVFRHCSSLESIAIPSTLKEIGDNSFRDCSDLRKAVLSDGLKKIGTFSFEGCTSLEHITIPSTVIEIEYGAFKCCTELREVVIHNEKVQIGDKAFRGCTALERFKFPRLSTRLDNIIQAGQRDIEAKMDDIPAVEWRGGELSILAIRQQREDRLGIVEIAVEIDIVTLDEIVSLIVYYEMKEATTLFELALWKAMIDQTDISSFADRTVCRIEVPGPVKDTILQYLR